MSPFAESNGDCNGGSNLESPFPCLQVDLSPDDLRETAYELFVAAHGVQPRSSVSTATDSVVVPSPMKSGAVRRFKKALTMGSRKTGSVKQLSDVDLMRLQMEISEKSDSRTKKALSRAQAGRPSKPLLVPLELLQHTSSSDFADYREYKRWQKRQLKVLEAGLPSSDKENADPSFQVLKQAIDQIGESTHETGKHSEGLQALRNAAVTVFGDDAHWADGYPFNVYLYEMLLRSIFDSLEETVFIDEFDEVMLLVKSTWDILGINRLLHKVCFVWILFRQFVITGKTEVELLRGAEIEMREISNHAEVNEDYVSYDLLNSTLTYIQAWAEQRLISYHKNFPGGGKGVMESLIGVALLAVQILHKNDLQQITLDPEDEYDIASSRVGIYIQASLRYAFDECKDGASSLETLAKQTSSLALKENELFSPTWKQWHPHPTSVAASTLHSCYRLEVEHFLLGLTDLSREAIQILQSAAELEKKLVQLDMEDKAVFDSRSAVIPPMIPFTLDANLASPLRKWIQERLDQLGAWLDRNVQQEEWSPNGTREHYALSVVEMLRFVEEASDAFFTLPVSQHPELLNDLIGGVDSALKQYINLCLVGCGSKDNYLHDPALRRQKEFSVSLLGKVSEAWQCKQEVLGFHKGKAGAKVSNTIQDKDEPSHLDPLSLQALCVRINTVHHLQTELEFLEKKICFSWQEVPFTKESKQIKLELTRAFCIEAVERLCDAAAYKVVSKDLCSEFWQGLYIPSVVRSRIGPVIDKLNSHLEIIARLVSDRLRNQVVNYLMMACFEEFLRVLVDVSSLRALSSCDLQTLQEDFRAMKDLFIADGEGLPEDLVEKAAEPIAEFLSSVHIGTESKSSFSLETNLRMIVGKSKSQKVTQAQGTQGFQNTTSKMSLTLGYKCHAMASKLVKKTYSFPKR